MTNYQRLEEFQKAIGNPAPGKPSLPDTATLELRARLLQEEYAETLEGLGELRADPDVRGEAFAHLMRELADMLYVTYGMFAACGVDADAVFQEVHRANMHKTMGPRRSDGKVLKPADWQPPDVQGVVKRLLED